MKLIGNLNNKLTEKPYIHRIELLDRFYKMLESKELVFVRPTCWTDPLENIIFNARIIREGKTFEHPAKKNIYGQCWSYESDSFALWNIYTTKSDENGIIKRQTGIRITTHIKQLEQFSTNNGGVFYYGLVSYLYKNKLISLQDNKEFIEGLKILELNDIHIKTLLVKRKSYAYEKELRLLYVPTLKQVDSKQDYLCRVKIEPKDFIHSLRIDPSLSFVEFEKIKEELVDKYGFASKQISQSTLNRENRFVFNLDNI